MRSLYSGSSLGRVRKCPASAALDTVEHIGKRADIGSALHEHMALRITHGIEYAVEQLPTVANRWELPETERSIFVSRAMHFEWSPPELAIPEVALALMEDGSTRRVSGGRGHYELPTGALFAMTIDIMWAAPDPLVWEGEPETGRAVCPPSSVLWAIDLKCGADRWVDPVESNDQALAGALLGARWTGARRVVPAIVYWRKGHGVWDVPGDGTAAQWLERDQLDAIEQQIRETDRRARQQVELHVRGEPLRYVEGSHCEFCPAQSRCPAKTRALKLFLEESDLPSALTEDQRRRAAIMLPQAERFIRSIRQLLQADVRENGPIDLGDGRIWGPHVVKRTTVDAALGERLLAAEVGPERARAAVQRELPRSAIEDAIRSAHAENGIKRKLAPTVRKVFAKLARLGGLEEIETTHWSAHKPQPEPPSLEEQLRASLTKSE